MRSFEKIKSPDDTQSSELGPVQKRTPFKDNRPEAVAQRRLQQKINNGSQVLQQKKLKEQINSSPKMMIQRKEVEAIREKTIQKVANKTGMPDHLKSGIENLSGMDMSDVRVHYNSPKPATIQAHAYAQGNNIHLASGQEKHLPHEAWHTVQQKQGRVKPTMQMKGKVNINDDEGLEREADVMGAKALQKVSVEGAGVAQRVHTTVNRESINAQAPIQREIDQTFAQHAGAAGPTQLTVEAYWEAIKGDFAIAENKFSDKEMPTRRHLRASYINYLAAYGVARSNDIWGPAAAALDRLAVMINESLQFSDHDDGFSNRREDSWATKEAGLTAMQGVVDANKIGDVKPKRIRGGTQHPDAPKIPWSKAKLAMPSAQKDLVLQIYLSWKYGRILDQRSDDQKEKKDKASDNPGALRSWHMNQQGQLPDTEAAEVPGNAQALHSHYKKTSVKPYEEPAAGPIGYAEYTGTGIARDAHYSKIVLDYKSGLVFMTLSHYGLWTKAGRGQREPEVGDKKAGSGTQSAWFAIDMTQ